MGILDKAKSNLGKKLNGNQELNKEVLRWKKSLLEANRLLEGKKEAVRAVDAFVYRVAKYIGAYAAAMNGVDAICFTAGLGENSAMIRRKVCGYLGYLGVAIREDLNEVRGQEIVISEKGAKPAVLVIPTNEELAIARETFRLVRKQD